MELMGRGRRKEEAVLMGRMIGDGGVHCHGERTEEPGLLRLKLKNCRTFK